MLPFILRKVLSHLALLSLLACSPQDPQQTESAPSPLEHETASSQNTKQKPADDDLFQAPAIDFPKAAPVMGMLGSRQLQSLNGTWNIIVDPMGIGNANAFGAGFSEDAQSITGLELIEYDFSAAETLEVPGDWNTQKERLFFYRGQVWYRRIFSTAPQKGFKYHLHFGAANYDTQVFLNGKPVGEHAGGYVPFAFDVTDNLKTGKNSLVVRVDNQLTESTIPTGRTDWWPYGGLVQDVSLITTPKSFIRNSKIKLENRETGEISIKLQTEGFRTGTEAFFEIEELNVALTLKIEKDGTATGVFTSNPTFWSPETPKLYTIKLIAGKEILTDRVGFRTIETRGTEILLNGKPIKLKGISTHSEPIGDPGIAYSREHMKTLLNEAKALNANFVRAAHYPYSRHLAEVADEVGILLWKEIPVYWAIDWTNPDTLSIAKDQMSRLVTRDWNRASVIIWSVANETPQSAARLTFLEDLITDVREMDDSRLVSAALLGGSRESFEAIVTHIAARGVKLDDISLKEKAIFRAILLRAGLNAPKATDTYTLVIDDPLSEHVDIVAYNEYFGWYYSKIFANQTGIGEDVFRKVMLDFMPDLRITANVQKPIHISEFGAGAKAGLKGDSAHIWTEEYQANVYAAQIEMLKNSPQVQGMTPWILKDFRAMLRPKAGVQDYYNRKGLIDENGQKKLAYGVLQEFYAGEW